MSFLIHARAEAAPSPRAPWTGVGAEDARCWRGSRRSLILGGPARRLGDWPRFELAFSRTASAGPTRRPRASGAGAPQARRWRVRASRLHGRASSRPVLGGLGEGRKERSDRRTRRVAGMSTRDIIEGHDGRTPCFCFLRAAWHRRSDESRGAGRGPGNGIESELLAVLPMTPSVALVTAHSIGWVSRRWRATSRTRWRSCTLTGPRGSSDRCNT